MGKIRGFKITFGDHKVPVYRPGETMFGTVSFVVSGEVKAKSVKMYLRGAAVTDWVTSNNERHAKSKEVYMFQALTLAGGNNDGGVFTLKEGLHQYPYRFQLVHCPKFPSSFESGDGAVRYWLQVRVLKPLLSFDDFYDRPFTMLTTLDVNDDCYKNPVTDSSSKTLSKALGLGNAGQVHMDASLDRGAYCPGESILLTVEGNNMSTKNLGAIRAHLIQSTWRSRAFTETAIDTTIMAYVPLDTQLNKQEKKEWTKSIEVPMIPSSTQEESCKIIKVSYLVEVIVDVPWGLNISLKLPVTIGTIAFGTKMTFRRVPKHAECQGSYIRLAPSKNNMCVRVCERGYQSCYLSDRRIPFPEISNFVPYTASIRPAFLDPDTTASAESNELNTNNGGGSAEKEKLEKPTTLSNETDSVGSPLPVSGAEAPPSYESLYVSDGAETRQENPTQIENGGQTGTDSVPWKGALIGLVFPQANLPTMKEFLKNNSKMISVSDGRLLAVFEEFQIISSDPTSAMFVLFDSEAQATQWSEHLTNSNPVVEDDLQIFLVENSSPSSSVVSDLILFPFVNLVMTTEDPTKTLTPEQDAKRKTSQNILFPSLRDQYGGKLILLSSKATLIRGDWSQMPYSPDQVETSVTLWPTEKLFQDYVKDLNSQADYHTHNEISKISSCTIVSASTLVNEKE